MTKLDDTENVELIEDGGETVDEFAEGTVRRVAQSVVVGVGVGAGTKNEPPRR